MLIVMNKKYNTDQFNSIILNRKSIYPYEYATGKKIPDEMVWQILENANRAPNHKQTEPWRFTVFSREGLQYFSKLQSSIYQKYAGDHFKESKYKKLVDYPLMSSHVISIGMKRNAENRLPEIEEIEAVACAVENMFLTVTAYGFGCYWTTGGITYIEEAKYYFGLEDSDKLLGFFYLGCVDEPRPSPTKRGDVKQKVKWIDTGN
jgi:nitroreductase